MTDENVRQYAIERPADMQKSRDNPSLAEQEMPVRYPPERHRPARKLRALAIACVMVAAGAAAGVGGAATLLRRGSATSAPAAVRTATALVVRTSLSTNTQVSGSIGYNGTYSLSNQMQGTAYTALPAAGARISRGGKAYEVDGSPVVLFYGSRPEWRSLSVGVANGPDIAELDANLVALGHASAADLPVSDVFTEATQTAVEAWQASEGLQVTGTIALGQIVYAPGPVRVTGVSVNLGSAPQPGGLVLTATSTTPVVVAQLPVNQEYLVRPGDHVTVTLPDGVTTTPAVVVTVSPVATDSGASSDGGASGPPGSAANSSQGGGPGGSGSPGSSQATVPVLVRLDRPAAAGNLDQAPVTVNVVSQSVRDVMAVPINALLALANGGYAVEVTSGSARHLVAVRTGLFASTLVQVSGQGLRPGMKVEVPAP